MHPANVLNLIFGLYVMALGAVGMSNPQFLVDNLNNTAVKMLGLQPLPSVGSDLSTPVAQFATTCWMLAFLIGLVYARCSFVDDLHFARTSVISRAALCVLVAVLVHFKRMSSGLLAFVVQDGSTALITLILLLACSASKPSTKPHNA